METTEPPLISGSLALLSACHWRGEHSGSRSCRLPPFLLAMLLMSREAEAQTNSSFRKSLLVMVLGLRERRARGKLV